MSMKNLGFIIIKIIKAGFRTSSTNKEKNHDQTLLASSKTLSERWKKTSIQNTSIPGINLRRHLSIKSSNRP